MLLRRVIEHVKTRNWTAVVLDFLIVVIGVFIGIQVSNWNDARSDKVREREYYDQIVKDLRADVAMARLVAHQAQLIKDRAKSSIQGIGSHLGEGAQ